MSRETLTLTAYFAERERTNDRLLAELMLEMFHDRDIAASVLLRGIAGFGVSNVALSDRSLTMADNAPVCIYAIDEPERILALADSVAAMTGRGVISLRRDYGLPSTLPEEAENVRLSVFLGRKHRVARAHGYMAVCDVLHRHRFSAAEVFLGVDGTVAGQRRRARFFGSNSEVPLLISGVATLAQTAQAVAELRSMLPDLLFTVDQILVCKHRGQQLADPRDMAGDSPFQKLTVRTSEDTLIDGQPVHRALIERLKDSHHTSGATVLRGMWGFLGANRRPHGDRFLQVARHVPVSTIIVDTTENVAASYAIINELTEHDGLVTCDAVPAMLGLHDGNSVGSLRLG